VGFSFGLFGVNNKFSKEKRARKDECYSLSCSEAGGPCFDQLVPPYSCQDSGKNNCWDVYIACHEAGDQNDNVTAKCECYGPAISCLEKSTNASCNWWSYDFWFSCVEECDDDIGYESDIDFCGTVPSVVVPECGDGYCQNYVCQALLPGGAQCTESEQCQSYDCSYDNKRQEDYGYCYNVTVEFSYGYPGDTCTESDDCYSDVCTKGICIGESLGQSCEDEYCNFGLYCGYNQTNELYTCMKTVPIGDECSYDYSGECTFPGECGYSESEDSDFPVCYTPYSVASGGSCQYYGECVAGLACGSNWKCGSPQTKTVLCDTYYGNEN